MKILTWSSLRFNIYANGYSFLFLEGVNCEEQGNGSTTRLLTSIVGLTFLLILGDQEKNRKYIYGKIDYLPFIFKLFNQTIILSKYLGKYFYFGTWKILLIFFFCFVFLVTQNKKKSEAHSASEQPRSRAVSEPFPCSSQFTPSGKRKEYPSHKY